MKTRAAQTSKDYVVSVHAVQKKVFDDKSKDELKKWLTKHIKKYL